MSKLLWVAGIAVAAMIPSMAMAQPYGVKEAPRAYVEDRRGYWVDAGPDTLSRENWLAHAIKASMDHGELDENEGNRALSQLEVIRHDDRIEREATSSRHDTRLNAEDIQNRLDELAHSVSFAIYHHRY